MLAARCVARATRTRLAYGQRLFSALSVGANGTAKDLEPGEGVSAASQPHLTDSDSRVAARMWRTAGDVPAPFRPKTLTRNL